MNPILSAKELAALLRLTAQADWLLIDVGDAERHAQQHLPKAQHLPYAELVSGIPPAVGELPPLTSLQQLFSRLGIGPDTQVVAYDDMGGAQAARLLWTLDLLGHPHLALLDGGLAAWPAAGLPLESRPVAPRSPSNFQGSIDPAKYIDQAGVLAALTQPEVQFWDARSLAEFTGEKAPPGQGGHIPGARQLDWVSLLTPERRLKSESELRDLIQQAGLRADRRIITYCQTHRRSALTYWVMKALGFTRIQGYAGAWAQWGSDPATPKATGPMQESEA